MGKLKVYLETTVFNRYFEPERDNHNDTLLLFEEIASGKLEAYSSGYVVTELMDASEPKRKDMLELLSKYNINILSKSDEVAALADEYSKFGVITEPHLLDRLHIACASVNRLDVIISFNFNHINRVKTKAMMPHVNQLRGYDNVMICVPMEVINYGE